MQLRPTYALSIKMDHKESTRAATWCSAIFHDLHYGPPNKRDALRDALLVERTMESGFKNYVRIRIALQEPDGSPSKWNYYYQLVRYSAVTKWSIIRLNCFADARWAVDSREKEFVKELGELLFKNLPDFPERIEINDELTLATVEYCYGKCVLEY